MIEEEVYNNIIISLKENLEGCSDMVNAIITPYDEYFTTTGKIKEGKDFQIELVISHYFLSANRLTSIIAETFIQLSNWMKEWENQIHFSEYKLTQVGGKNSRLEYIIYFDDILTSAKKLLLR